MPAAESQPHEIVLSRLLAETRRAAEAQIALLFSARNGGPLVCTAVDAEPGTWWSNAGVLLLGLVLQPNATLSSARRQQRSVVIPTADLPAYTARGSRFTAHDLPPWTTAVPLIANRAQDALLALIGQRPLRATPGDGAFSTVVERATRLGRFLEGGATTTDRADARPPLRLDRRPVSESDAFRLLLSLPLLGVIVVRLDGAVVAANDEGRRALAVLQGDEDRSLTHVALRALLTDESRGAAREIEAADEEGGHRYLRAAVAPAPQGDYLLISVQDITDERLMHERLLQSEKMASIGQLVSGVAHELNNPLTGIMGFAQLLLTRDDLPDGVRRELSTVFDEAARAARIVQNLLSFARRRRAEKEPVDLNELVERVLELRSYDLRVHNIEPRARLSRALAPVLADPHQIQQVLLNVIRNAEQAIRDRGGHGTITITTTAAGRMARIVVADNGGGIAPENLRRIFDPFYTTKPPGEGTGLGLTIVYGIVEEHGGHVRVDSQLGKGTTFQIELPLAEGEAAEHAPGGAGRRPRKASGRSILVIDDEASIREVLFILLSRDGHEVETVADGLAGLERLAERDFDLIITDVRMPGVDGIEFYNRVRAWNPAMAERILFTTGDIVNPTTRDFLASVPNRHLQKPFSLAEVREVIAALLRR